MSKRVLIPVLNAKIDYYLAALERQGAEPVVVHSFPWNCVSRNHFPENVFHEERFSKNDSSGNGALKHGSGENISPALAEKSYETSGNEIKLENIADAILLPGGADIDPIEYGEVRDGAGEPDDALDELQMKWLDLFVRAGKPVFGICRGHQLINVYFGGTLFQDLSDRPVHAKKSLAEPDKYHDARVVSKDSWIYGLYHKMDLHINSSHHEAVERLGEGLVADLWSTAPEDRQPVLEGMHHETLPVWSVQFHPERCNPEFPEPGLVDGDAIFKFWVSRIH